MAATMQRGALNIFETFQTFYNVLSCVGFVPFRVDIKSGNIHKRSVYYTAFFLSLYSSTLFVSVFLGQKEPDAEESRLVRYGNYTLYLQSTSIIIFVVGFNYLKRQEIVNCLLAMHHFDCTVEVGQMGTYCALHLKVIEENLFISFHRLFNAPSR